jgi:hypothetical protein
MVVLLVFVKIFESGPGGACRPCPASTDTSNEDSLDRQMVGWNILAPQFTMGKTGQMPSPPMNEEGST